MIKSRIRSWPIRRKLILSGLLTSLIALLLSALSIIVYESYEYRHDVAAELSSVADMIAVNSSAPLIFNDEQSAMRTLVPPHRRKKSGFRRHLQTGWIALCSLPSARRDKQQLPGDSNKRFLPLRRV
jgi:hypothetical protein